MFCTGKNISPGVLRDGGAESIPLDLTQVMLAEEGRAEKFKSTENLDVNLKSRPGAAFSHFIMEN